MLWIALHLPQLSLEAWLATRPPPGDGSPPPPVALLDGSRLGRVDPVARAAGLRPGQSRATALALAPHTEFGPADPARDQRALAAVVDVALSFSPTVSVAPWSALGPERRGEGAGAPARTLTPALGPGAAEGDPLAPTVLLEVTGTLAYWGGRDQPPARQRIRLLQRLLDRLAPLGHALQVATAPTAAGAALLALQAPVIAASGPAPRRARHAEDLTALRRQLDAAPLGHLGPARPHLEAMQGMGLNRIGDLRRLPRAGLARRFGEALLDALDRAGGERPDPRPLAVLPEHFDSAVELSHRADTAEQLMHGAALLMHRLAAWLRAGQARTRRTRLRLLHERGRWAAALDEPGVEGRTATDLEIALAEPTDDALHLIGLLRERLGRAPLPAPTLDLRLHCEDRVRMPAPAGELFPTAGSQREGLARLLERLQARLGREGVQRPVRHDDHRPERANRLQPLDEPAPPRLPGPPAGAPASAAHLPRPVWLVHPPEPLAEGERGPRWGAQPLQLLSGPERLETGWWDEDWIERDYFIAQTPEGALLWVYRLRRPMRDDETPPGRPCAHGGGSGAWFLHGRFG